MAQNIFMKYALLLGTGLAMAGPVWSESPPSNATKSQCFRVYEITKFHYVDAHHIFFEGRFPKENFLARIPKTCRDLNFTNNMTVSFENRYICPPFAEYIDTDQGHHCLVDKIDQVSSSAEAEKIVALRNGSQ